MRMRISLSIFFLLLLIILFSLLAYTQSFANEPHKLKATNPAHIADFQSVAPTGQQSIFQYPIKSHRFQYLVEEGDAHDIGGTQFLGKAIVEAALAAGHEVTLFN